MTQIISGYDVFATRYERRLSVDAAIRRPATRPRASAGASHRSIRPSPLFLEQTVLAGLPVRLGPGDVVELARRFEHRNQPSGSLLFGPKKRPAAVSIVSRGRVELSRGSGSQRQVIELAGRGRVLGDTWVLLGTDPEFSARCLDETETWDISDVEFTDLLATRPDLANAWLHILASRLVEAKSRTRELVGHNLRYRLAKLIYTETVDDALRVPQRTIANMLGVQRTSVNRNLKALEKDGTIRLEYGQIVVLDRKRLRSMIEPS